MAGSANTLRGQRGMPQIGGYTMINQWPLKYLRTKELLLRWMECSAFSDVIFRTHPGNLPSLSWQYNSDNETLSAFKTWASVHRALWPYRQQLVELASSTGVPVTRHPWLQYPSDPTVRARACAGGACIALRGGWCSSVWGQCASVVTSMHVQTLLTSRVWFRCWRCRRLG